MTASQKKLGIWRLCQDSTTDGNEECEDLTEILSCSSPKSETGRAELGWVHESSTGSTGAAGWGMVSKLPSEDKATMSCGSSKKELENRKI